MHSDAIAVICPAFPDLGRTVAGGVVLVDGVPVAASASGGDPVTPVTASALERVIPGSVHVRAGASDIMSRGGTDRFLVDGRTTEDLADLAATIDRLGPRVIAVGSAGLARALADRWRTGAAARVRPPHPTARRVLVAVNSLHPAAQEQVVQLLRTVPEACLVDPEDARLMNDRMTLEPGIRVVCPSVTPRPNHSAGTTTTLVRQVVAELASFRFDALVLVGGDGALAVLDELKAEGITITGSLSVGVPRGIVLGGLADGLPVVTRSGGFGDAGALVKTIRRLRNEPASLDSREQKEPQ